MGVRITWLGEDELHPDGNGPRHNRWGDVTFTIGQAVDVDDPHIIAKARGNPFFRVEDEKPKPTLTLPPKAK